MMALRGWCTSPSATANPPFQSRQAQLESGVRGNVPAPFGAGERLQGPTYRYIGETCRKVTRPDPTHLGGLASPHGVDTDRRVVLNRGNPPGAAVDTRPDLTTSALWVKRTAD